MLKLNDGRTRLLAVGVVLLLFIGWLRLQHIVEFVEWPDEIWSVWQVRGTFSEAMTRVPYDWPPLFSAITWGWQQIVGDRLEASRYMMVLFSLIGGAVTYQAAIGLSRLAQRPLRKSVVLILSMVAWAAAAYSIFAGVDVRAYGLLLTLGMAAFWLITLWILHPTRKLMLVIAIVVTLMIYSSYTSIVYTALLSLFVVVLRPRYFIRWAIIMIGAFILCIPLLPPFFANAANRLSVMPQPMPTFGTALQLLFQDFGGSAWFLIPLIFALVLAVFAFVRFPQQRRLILLLAIWIGTPIAIYFLAGNREFWRPRYMWWVMIGLVLFLGYALSYLPRPGYVVAGFALVLLPIAPVNWYTYRQSITNDPPFRDTFSWLAQHMRPGDVIVIDPNCTCGDKIGWDYFGTQYFPTGYLPIVAHPGDASRVWYVSTDGYPHDQQLLAEVQKGRKASIFVGPWNFLWRLYEGPPSWTGVLYGDAIRLHGVEIENDATILPEDKSVQLKLWWSAAKPLNLDYTVGIVLLDRRGKVVAQVDGPPTAPDTPSQTSQWQPGTYYEDYRTLQIPPQLDGGTYTLAVGVYQWWDNTHLIPEQNTLYPNRTSFNYLIIRRFEILTF